MSTSRILVRSIATLLALTPFASRAGTQTIFAAGDPLNGTAGVNPSWGVAANWSGSNGASLPGVNDLAQIELEDFTNSAVDIRGSDFVGPPANFTEVQGIAFVGGTSSEVDLENNSTTNDMTLALNGGGGTVPLIQTGNFPVQITRVGFGTVTPTTRTLSLQLKGNGDVSVGTGGLNISASITSAGAFGFNKTGSGTLTLSGNTANSFTGTTTVSEGLLVAGKTAGINAISGNLVIGANGSFIYANNNVSNQIADTASITVNGGTFGDPNSAGPTNPGATDTVANVTVNSGNFNSGRNATLTPFTITGTLNVAGGAALVQRGGGISAGTVQFSSGSLNLDGGSTTANQESKFIVGAGGLNLTNSMIFLNAGPSSVTSGSVGSIVTLNGPVTSTGSSGITRLNPTLSNARVDLGGGTRTFNVTGDLTFGAANATVPLTNGGIVKTGTGTLTLASPNTLAGTVTVSGGSLVLGGSIAAGTAIAVQNSATLVVNSTLPAGRAITVANGGTLSGTGTVTALTTAQSGSIIQPGNSSGAGTLTLGTLTLGSAAGDTNTLNLTTTSEINVTGTNGLICNGGAGKVTVNITGPAPAVGQYVLIDYAGNIGGAGGTNSFVVGSLPSPRLAANISVNTTNTSVQLNVTGLDFPVWKGALSSEWSTATLASPKNWVLNSNNSTTTDFLPNDTVTFNDLATNTSVDVSVADVSPSSMNFANPTKDYTVSGSLSIIGAGNLTKTGAGRLTITNTNGFTGSVSLGGGTVSVATLADAGVGSPLGAGASMSFNGGTLEFTGAGGSTNRAITVNSNGGTLKSDVPLTFSGAIGGPGALTKVGNGMLTLTGTNTYGATVISAGVVQVGDGNNTGSLGSGAVTNNTALIFNRSDTGLTVNGAISGTGTVTQNGFGTTTLGGTVANTYSGLTTINAGTLAAGKTAGVNAIPGSLDIEAGGAFIYANNNVSNQIADTASITINGGSFGDPVSSGPTNPGATDIVANVTVNSGTFNSGRNDTLTPFTISGTLNIAGGNVLAQRGGGISAGTVQFSAGSLNLDGGSTTAGQESKLIVGAGGLTMGNNTIYLNFGPSPITATSVGSIVTLNGGVTSTGTSGFVNLNPTAIKAAVDLGGGVRNFNVTGTLGIGSTDAPIAVSNGGINLTGAGILTLSGAPKLTSLSIGSGSRLTFAAHSGGAPGIKAIDTSALIFTGNGKLDLANNAMVVRGGNEAAITAKVASGFDGGLWDGPGVNSSTAATDPNFRTGVAVVNNADLGYTSFAGVTGLTGSEILLKYTYFGDSDLSGTVTSDDFGLFLDGYNHVTPPKWVNGDYDYSGTVTSDDFGLFIESFNNQGGALRDPGLAARLDAFAQQIGADGSSVDSGSAGTVAAGQAAVPEPASAVLMAAGALGLGLRRQRRG